MFANQHSKIICLTASKAGRRQQPLDIGAVGPVFGRVRLASELGQPGWMIDRLPLLGSARSACLHVALAMTRAEDAHRSRGVL